MKQEFTCQEFTFKGADFIKLPNKSFMFAFGQAWLRQGLRATNDPQSLFNWHSNNFFTEPFLSPILKENKSGNSAIFI